MAILLFLLRRGLGLEGIEIFIKDPSLINLSFDYENLMNYDFRISITGCLWLRKDSRRIQSAVLIVFLGIFRMVDLLFKREKGAKLN